MSEKWKQESEEVLDKFVEDAKNSQLAGSGDDAFYFKQPSEYVNKQKRFWIEYGIRVFNRAEEHFNNWIYKIEKRNAGLCKEIKHLEVENKKLRRIHPSTSLRVDEEARKA